MRKYAIVFLIITVSFFFPLFAADEASLSPVPAIGTLHMSSSVERNAGVVVPEGAELVGNILVEYSLNSSEWYYVNESAVTVDSLGAQSYSIYLRARYYGNEPSEYNCTVAFSTTGWNRTSRSFISSRSADTERDYYDQINANSDLPITFGNLDISYTGTEASVQNYGAGYDSLRSNIMVESSSDDSFRLVVPVQGPINGDLIATLEASWPQSILPSGDYSADIQIAVSTGA